MPRRQRRAGVKYIKDDREREITFYKRRSGMFKVAADLSALTGANAAVVLETNNGKMHSFGTPSTDPIVDAFLSGRPPAGPFASEVLKAKIRRMQNDLVRLEARKVEDGKRASLSTKRASEVLDETPTMVARRVFGKVVELDLDEVSQHILELTRVHQGISHRLPSSLHRRRQEEIGVRSMPPPPQWPSLPQQNRLEEIGGRSMPPPRWPSPPQRNTLPSSQGFSSTLSLPPTIPPLQSSWSHLFPLRPPSSFPNLQAPSPRLPPSPAPLQVPPLPEHTPLCMEPQPYSHYSFGTEIIGNGAPPVPLQPPSFPSAMSPATFLSPLPNQLPQIPPSPQLPAKNYTNPSNNPVEPPQNYEDPNSTLHVEELSPLLDHASSDDFPEDDPFAHGQWAADLVDEQYYSNLLGLNADLGSDDGGDMNQVGGDYDMYAATGLPIDDGWVDMLLESSSWRGNDTAGAGN